MPGHWITNPVIFYGVSSVILAYIVYLIVRRRKGERPGQEGGEAEL
jgi:hypothetical protein